MSGGGVSLHRIIERAYNRADNLSLHLERTAMNTRRIINISTSQRKIYTLCQSATHGSVSTPYREAWQENIYYSTSHLKSSTKMDSRASISSSCSSWYSTATELRVRTSQRRILLLEPLRACHLR